MIRSTRAAAVAAAVLVFLSACARREDPQASTSPPRIELNLHGSEAATVDVTGLSAADLGRLQQRRLTPDEWSDVLRIVVASDAGAPADRPPVLGSYSVANGVLRFTPQFPFDPGQRYDVTFNLSHASIKSSVEMPAPARRATTRVVEMFPSGGEVPENLLRMYVSFSAPMSLAGGSSHVHLLDQSGHAVDDPFLPLDVDLWNEDRTRYTLLFDPGRVKRGIVPNEEMGRSLIEGRRYTLLIDDDWRDANGQPLARPFRHEFIVGPPQERGLDPSTWRLEPPRANTTDPLLVSFAPPLDYGLLFRALSVSTTGGNRVAGEVRVEAGETRWMFTPRAPWQPGEYRLTVASILEDAAGNRIGRPFEAEIASGGTVVAEAKPAALLFRVAAGR